MRNIGIIGTGSFLPNQVLSNRDLEKQLDTTDKWIFTKTGIKNRHIAASSEATSDLALYASLDAIRNASLHPEDIDLIILATSSPDMLQPSTASILQGKLGAINAAAFDVGSVCAGFIYALSTAFGFMKGFDKKYKNVLVIGAETYSRILDWSDRTTSVFFGDGAGAVVLSDVEDDGYIGHHIMNDGKGWDVIKFPAGASRTPATHDTIKNGLHAFQMEGRLVWEFATKIFPETVHKVIDDANLNISDIDMLISHQANINIIQKGMDTLGLPFEKTFTTIEDTANTSGASIPIALDHAVKSKKLKKDDLLCLVGFGGGLSWGAMLLRWSLK